MDLFSFYDKYGKKLSCPNPYGKYGITLDKATFSTRVFWYFFFCFSRKTYIVDTH